MDSENRDKWMQSKTEVERRKDVMALYRALSMQDGLEKMVDALRQALRSAEEQNTRMQESRVLGKAFSSRCLGGE